MSVARQLVATALDVFQEALVGVRIQVEPVGDGEATELAT